MHQENSCKRKKGRESESRRTTAHLSSGFSVSEEAVAAAGWVSNGASGLDQETAEGVLHRKKTKQKRKPRLKSPQIQRCASHQA